MVWDVVGHERALETLRAGLETDTLPQSLLLTGPRQVGKQRLAVKNSDVISMPRVEGCEEEIAGLIRH